MKTKIIASFIALSAAFGLVAHPHVQRDYVLTACNGNPFGCLGDDGNWDDRIASYWTPAICDRELHEMEKDVTHPLRCVIGYHFEFGY